MGAYTAFLDLTLGIAGPALGWVADRAGLRSVYAVGVLFVLGATRFAVALLRRARAPAGAGDPGPMEAR